MSNQPPYPPQQPGWGNGQPPYGQPPFQPEPPKKHSDHGYGSDSGTRKGAFTVDGKTKKGHASGGYNICNAQLSSNFTGGWS